MPRTPRVWYPGAKYHITARGTRKLNLFFEPNDYTMYLTILKEAQEEFHFLLHAYCLMSNHVHLQMETFDISTSHIMKYVHATYARSFNKKYDLTGHVFQGRYHAKIIENVKYELEVQKYIHMNPVEANVVKHPGDYKWSSYLAYSLGEDNPLVSTSHILSYFNEPQRENYDLFIQTANDELWLESMTNVKNIHRGERYVK